jgi:micrococcal nuclease
MKGIDMKKIVFILAFLFIVPSAFSTNNISPEDAINHIGQQATVCGNVASTHFSSRSKGQPTFINLNRPYPNQIFTVLIWGSDRSKFPGAPENYYSNKRICVSGKIQQYKGAPEIVVKSPNQISEEK